MEGVHSGITANPYAGKEKNVLNGSGLFIVFRVHRLVHIAPIIFKCMYFDDRMICIVIFA
jgi:hypothetical protein